MQKTITITVDFTDQYSYNSFKNEVLSVVEKFKSKSYQPDSFVSAKVIGKQITSLLRSNHLDSGDIEDMCIKANLNKNDLYSITDLTDAGEYKRVGKKIAFFIDYGRLEKDVVVKFLKTWF
jgi:hypothetical protein